VKVGLIGYAGSGKTTLLDAVSGGKRKGDLVAVPVPDPRFEAICAAVQPKKRVPVTVEILDNAATLRASGSQAGFAEAARRMDVLLHVVREFDSPVAPFHAEPNIARDQGLLEAELILADLGIVENRLSKLARSLDAKKPGQPEFFEKNALEKLKPELEDGEPIRRVDLSEEEKAAIVGFQMLTAKPIIIAINCGESEIGKTSDFENNYKDPVFRICAEIEKEIALLEADERKAFLDDLGIEQPASEALVRSVYDALGLITFFTAGENITQAWPLRRGSSALRAADTIHSDIARGFIRAEVTHYDDFAKHCDMKAAYTANAMKLEGKDYIVQDGDIINIRNKS
jgi:GTP-binding protein YchF